MDSNDKKFELAMAEVLADAGYADAEIKSNEKSTNKNYLIDNKEEYVKFLETMLSLMPHEYERILINDYFHDRNVKWWQEFYSKSTYYRRKHEAVKLFVDCLSL